MEKYGNNRSWQARLQRCHDIIKRKVLDNSIAHEGNPTDCIRIHVKKNDEGDYESRILEEADIVHVVFPPLSDVPVRRIWQDHKLNRIMMTSLPESTKDEKDSAYTIVAPQSAILLPGDLIVRIMEDTDTDKPIIVCLEVLEALGTFGGSMLIMMKYQCHLYNETLDAETLKIIVEMAKRRLYLKF